jgi:N-acyl homoserine lactone hydrolase
MKRFAVLCISLCTSWTALGQEQKIKPDVKLYAMDCGTIEVANFGDFSDTGDYDGKTARFPDVCFLIKHPKGTLIWDTGLPDSVIKEPITNGPYGLSKTMTIEEQLAKIHMKTSDIHYVALSHTHFDHTGGLESFSHSTWIMNKIELNFAKTNPLGNADNPTSKKNWSAVQKKMINTDYDVFEDGTVRIIKTPGHTPGHQSLVVQLPKSGTVILSGDALHQRTSLEPVRIPVFNTNRAESIASIDRIKGILKNTKGRLVVQHDAADFAALPKFPRYLD